MDKKKVVVIGAGFGGLGSAILLARAGYDVTVVEKNDKVGGRANLLEIDGYRRDMGPSWYLMPDAFDRYFTAIGRKVEDYLDLQKLEPSYRVFFKAPLLLGEAGGGLNGGYNNNIYSSSENHKEKLIEFARELRKRGTSGEKFVREFLRNRKYKDMKRRRQHPLGNYIADFYCHEAKLVIEIDGPQHQNQKQYDSERDQYMKEELGLQIIRVSSDSLYEQPGLLFEMIDEKLSSPQPFGQNLPHPNPLPTATLGEAKIIQGSAPYLDLYADIDQAAQTFEAIEQGSGDKLRAYLKSAAYQYGIAMEKFVFKNFDSIWDFMTPQLAIEGMQLNVFTKLYNYISRFVKNENLKKLLMYPSVFLGTSPYETPALFNIMSHVDFNQGVFYPQGGIHEIPKALYQIALEEGVKFEFNAEVEKIVVEDKKVVGVKLRNDIKHVIDDVSDLSDLVNIHNFFVGILISHSIPCYLGGGLGLSLIVGAIHRLPKDLDYVVSHDNFLKLEKIFTDENISYVYSSKGSIIIKYDGVDVEFESPQSIEKFVLQQTGSTINLTNCFDSEEVCVDGFTSKKLKPDFYRTIWNVFGGAKYPLDEQMLNNTIIPADIIISNADMRHTETQLLELSQQTYPESYWAKQVISPSGFILYLGVDGELPQLKHHTLVFSDDWRGGFDQIFKDPQRPQDPNYYICNPSKTDPTVAPAGKENLFVLVPIAPGLESTPQSLEAYKDQIMTDIAHNCGIPDLQDRIEVSQIFSIPQFEQYYNAYKGTALGLAHTFFQSAVRRPQNYSKKVKGLYYAGGYTTPGIGMPMCLISAMMVADRVEKNK